MILLLLFKLAGFVYKSFWINTNQIFLYFFVHESNPWIESFENRSTNQIRNMNLANLDLQIRNFSDLFCAIVLRICEDSLDLWKQVESLKIGWIRNSRFKINLLKSGFVIHDMIQIKDSFCKAQIEPFWSQDSWSQYGTNPWIRKTYPCFTNLLYDSCNPTLVTAAKRNNVSNSW